MKGLRYGLILLLFSCSVLAFDRSISGAGGTIYIRADGSVEGTTYITSGDNVTYAFTADINDSVVVQRNNILVDGSGHALQGTLIEKGFYLLNVNNVTIEHTDVQGYEEGFYLDTATGIKLLENNITNNLYGIYTKNTGSTVIDGNNMTQNSYYDIMLYNSSHNNISNNMVKSPNEACIFLDYSCCNIVSGNDLTSFGVSIRLWFSSDNNTLTENSLRGDAYGIELSASSNNSIYHNNFIGNPHHVSTNGSINAWNSGYPSGGNYWSDYADTDSNHDGIGNTPYVIDANNTDRYPLMGMFYGSPVMWQEKMYAVSVISNSTVRGIGYVISTFIYLPNHTITKTSFDSIYFWVSGEDGTYGFCRVCIPVALMNNAYRVSVNGTEVPYSLLPYPSSTENYIYFTYSHSTESVEITPEFPSFLILPLFIIATLLAVIIYRKKYAAQLHP